ncbi:Glycoside hydrolase family 18 protein [Mycena venus]|uniref:Glycoside hydrolase family 18 protein n=1 Tax=Mycena venus TaxID=2733690 RepID=A0A8H7D230_9AGAR|nr:Glycoside hydrolase family 18 protein [Mycena venus]
MHPCRTPGSGPIVSLNFPKTFIVTTPAESSGAWLSRLSSYRVQVPGPFVSHAAFVYAIATYPSGPYFLSRKCGGVTTPSGVVAQAVKMVSLSLARIISISSVFLCLARVNSTPLNATIFDGLDQQARDILARATPAAPHWVVYSDQYVSGTTGPPAVSPVKGFNVFALSFLLTEGAFDKAYEWTTLTDAQRASVKAQYNAAGIKLIVSVFGSTDVPTSSGVNPIAMATTMAKWVKQYNLDGIDVDYEDFNAFDTGDGKAEAWLISFTQQLRTLLPQGTYILTHAPVAPWFSPNIWGGGGYLKVHAAVGNLIDWYNVQFYNRGGSDGIYHLREFVDDVVEHLAKNSSIPNCFQRCTTLQVGYRKAGDGGCGKQWIYVNFDSGFMPGASQE